MFQSVSSCLCISCPRIRTYIRVRTGMVNFTSCQAVYNNNPSYLSRYAWNGAVRGGFETGGIYITLEGCETLCGSGPDYYAWKDAAATITTWVLPMLGMILSAPFESNDFIKTSYALCHWLGSPIASLSYIFWNIRVTAKCCLMVDMSVGYTEFPPADSQYGWFRDSMLILTSMNQYSFIDGTVNAERLLRTAVFSNLPLPNIGKTLPEMRSELAHDIRNRRRRGVVACFISLLWFLVCLAISIEAGKFTPANFSTVTHGSCSVRRAWNQCRCPRPSAWTTSQLAAGAGIKWCRGS